MSTKQYNTKEEYFNNNGKGFDSPYEVNFPNLNIKVEVYSCNLKPNKVAQIKSDIEETVKNFQSLSNLEQGSSEKVLKIYIFDNEDDYSHLGSRFGLGLGDEGGKTYYKGEQNTFAEMYVYQAGGIHNLKHELAHGFTYVATEGKSLPAVLMEGIADYIEHSSDQNFNTQEGFSIDAAERAMGTRNLDIDSILELRYSENTADNSLVYKMGHVLVMYLKEKGALNDCLKAGKAGDTYKVEQIIRSNYDQQDFRDWLSQHNTETAMKEMNALQVTKGEFIATKEEIIDGEIKDVSYYKANIERMDGSGDKVGQFSTTSHYYQNNTVRVENMTTHDLLDLSQQYGFMKLVNHDGEMKLIHCDKDGNEYKNSQEYINQVANIAAKYDERAKQDFDSTKGKVDHYYSIMGERHNYIVDSEEADATYKKLEHAQKEFEQTKESLAKNIHGQTKDIVEELTYFDQNQVRSTNGSSVDFEYGKIYSVRSDGASSAKLKNGVSIYDGNNKVGELLTESGYFTNVKGSDKDTFIFTDNLMGLHTKYGNGAYIAVTKENGEFTASLIDGRAVSKDEYYDKPHLHRNELLEPSINHINKEKIDDSLLLKGTEFLDHSESEAAKVHTIVKKGELLDNKGTERTEDDVYEAKIEQDDFMYKFQNKGFYIDERGDFFIHDRGKNVRYQLPDEITHLKLIEKDGAKKLVPVTKDGNEHPYGMPSDITDEYRYVDPIFAHEYEKKDHSHKHTNIGLINFDQYKLGTMFAMKYDPNDLPEYANDQARQLDSKQSHFTKVKLFDEGGKEIGMLSNNFHNYTDKIFFSVDYNYSYNNFLASVAPQVNIKDQFNEESGKWTKVITFDQGKGDIGGTDKGYTDYQKIYAPGNKKSQHDHQDEQMQGDQLVAPAHKGRPDIARSPDLQYNAKQSGSKDKRATKEEVDINARDHNGQTALHRAIESGNTEQAQHLIDSSANLNIQDDYYRENDKHAYSKTPLHYAVDSGNVELTQYLLKHGANPNLENAYGRAPLYEAVHMGNLELVQSLLGHNADVNFIGKYGYNKPLIFAAIESGNAKIVELLAKHGADLNVHNTSAQTPLHCAIELGHTEVAKYLIDIKANINTQDISSGKSPLHLAMSMKNIEITKHLIDSGADVNIQDSYGLTPLHHAINLNDQAMVQYLIKNNADINLKDSSGWTPLANAVRYGLSDIAESLVNNGADVNIKCNNLTLYGCAEYGIRANSKTTVDYNQKHQERQELLDKIKTWEKIDLFSDESIPSNQPVVYPQQHDDQFDRKDTELKKAIEEGDIVIYRVKENSKSDGEHLSTTFKMITKSREAEANNEYKKSIKLDSDDFNIKKVTHQEGIEDGDKLFYVLYKSDPSQSGFYNLGKEKIGFKALVKSLEDPKYKCTYHGNIDNKFSISGQDNHNQQHAHPEQMQSDQSQIEKVHHKVSKNHAKQEDIVLKDTILSVSKSDTADEHGRYKAEIKIEYKDIKSLYDNASSGEEQQYVWDFWHALNKNNYKIGDLPGKKYYFKDGNFIIKNEQGNSIKLPEENISFKMMHLKDNEGKDHLELVVLNKISNKVVGYVQEIDNLSYELLRSDSDILSHLETHKIQDNLQLQFSEHHDDYDTYLMEGLEAHIFGYIH